MVDVNSAKDIPPRVMELLRIFLAASSRGEEAVFVLETRQKRLTTKYRSMETVAGNPATTSTSTTNPKIRKVNPARTRRSRLRLEKFNQKKVKEREEQEEANPKPKQTGDQDQGSLGAADTSSTRLVIEIAKEKDRSADTRSGLPSPILQVDGDWTGECGGGNVRYSFKSDYAEEDILDSLQEIFPESEAKLEERVPITPLSNNHLCTVMVKELVGQNPSWPVLEGENVEVFRELRRIQ